MVSMAWEGIARARKINPATADAKMVVVFFFFHVFFIFFFFFFFFFYIKEERAARDSRSPTDGVSSSR